MQTGWRLVLFGVLLAHAAAGAELQIFRVSPEAACAGEAVEVAARIEASPAEEHRLEVRFLRGEAEGGRLETGLRKGPATWVATWSPPDAGAWRARANLSPSGDGAPAPSEAAFEVKGCPPVPESRASASFKTWPRWVEARPGQAVALDVVLTSPGGRLQPRIDGSAAKWVAVSPAAAEAARGSPAVFAMALQAPKDAAPGSASVEFQVDGERFLLPVQVKPGRPDNSLPQVLRTLVQKEGATEVSLRVLNGNLPAPRLELLEAVETALAPAAADLSFPGTPPAILNESPALLRWVLEDLAPEEERTVAYRVERSLPGNLPAWPVRQVNVVPGVAAAESAPVQLVRLDAAPLVSGRPGRVLAEVRNLRSEPLAIGALVELPAGWGSTAERHITLAPGASENMTFEVSPPAFASGAAVGRLRLKAGSQQVERAFSLAVSPDAGPLVALVLLGMAAAGGVYLLRWRRSIRRSETLLHLREMRRRLR